MTRSDATMADTCILTVWRRGQFLEPAHTTPELPDRGEGLTGLKGPHYGCKGPVS